MFASIAGNATKAAFLVATLFHINRSTRYTRNQHEQMDGFLEESNATRSIKEIIKNVNENLDKKNDKEESEISWGGECRESRELPQLGVFSAMDAKKIAEKIEKEIKDGLANIAPVFEKLKTMRGEISTIILNEFFTRDKEGNLIVKSICGVYEKKMNLEHVEESSKLVFNHAMALDAIDVRGEIFDKFFHVNESSDGSPKKVLQLNDFPNGQHSSERLWGVVRILPQMLNYTSDNEDTEFTFASETLMDWISLTMTADIKSRDAFLIFVDSSGSFSLPPNRAGSKIKTFLEEVQFDDLSFYNRPLNIVSTIEGVNELMGSHHLTILSRGKNIFYFSQLEDSGSEQSLILSACANTAKLVSEYNDNQVPKEQISTLNLCVDNTGVDPSVVMKFMQENKFGMNLITVNVVSSTSGGGGINRHEIANKFREALDAMPDLEGPVPSFVWAIKDDDVEERREALPGLFEKHTAQENLANEAREADRIRAEEILRAQQAFAEAEARRLEELRQIQLAEEAKERAELVMKQVETDKLGKKIPEYVQILIDEFNIITTTVIVVGGKKLRFRENATGAEEWEENLLEAETKGEFVGGKKFKQYDWDNFILTDPFNWVIRFGNTLKIRDGDENVHQNRNIYLQSAIHRNKKRMEKMTNITSEIDNAPMKAMGQIEYGDPPKVAQVQYDMKEFTLKTVRKLAETYPPIIQHNQLHEFLTADLISAPQLRRLIKEFMDKFLHSFNWLCIAILSSVWTLHHYDPTPTIHVHKHYLAVVSLAVPPPAPRHG